MLVNDNFKIVLAVNLCQLIPVAYVRICCRHKRVQFHIKIASRC